MAFVSFVMGININEEEDAVCCGGICFYFEVMVLIHIFALHIHICIFIFLHVEN